MCRRRSAHPPRNPTHPLHGFVPLLSICPLPHNETAGGSGAAELSNVHVVLRLSRFGSGFRERVDRVRVFWSAQRGARIAVPRCSRVYIWSAKTRRLSVRVHQNHTLRSTLLTMQGGYGPLSLWQQHRCSSWRQTQCKDGLISSRQQQQRTSLRQHSTRVYRPGCRAQVPGLAQCVRLSL